MPSQSYRTDSARINFGMPYTEYILRIDKLTGEAVSCYNQDTNTEYIGGGGGGDSDFSTAEVTFNNTATGSYWIGVPRIETDKLVFNKINVLTPVTVAVPLYKGSCTFLLIADSINTSVKPTFTGGVSIDETFSFITVTGDGTFTAAGGGIS